VTHVTTLYQACHWREGRTDVGRRSHSAFRRTCGVVVLVCLAVMTVTACGIAPAAQTTNVDPIKIGISLSLTGDFAADGQAFQQGYQLWANSVNASGGLLGRKVTLDILDDASSDTKVVTNYQQLITVDHCDLLFGPFSTKLTKPAAVTAQHYGYAFVEGAGGGPSVFTQGLNNVFDVSLPVANNLISFTRLMLSLPPSERPQTAAYATEDDPFTQPQIDLARQLLGQAGIQTVSYTVYSSDTTNFAPIAQKLVNAKADIVVLGTLLEDFKAFTLAFKQQNYNPKAIVGTAGPDQGNDFLNAIGGARSAEGIMVPNGWYPQQTTPGNQAMVRAYLKAYEGDISAISSDVPEAYSVGQVVQQAIAKTKSLDQAKLIAELHKDTFTSVQGPVKFDDTGQNVVIETFMFQWQGGQLVPIYPLSSDPNFKPPEYPRPDWP
jgi:branched-chain amino acid transport system substrate-binding protein